MFGEHMLIGKNNYKLIALDTNVLREVCMDNEEYKKRLFKKFVLSEEKYAFCFSIYNVLELRPYQDIFERFIEFFCQLPALMFFPYSLILKKEAECYKTGLDFKIDNSIANAFSSEGKEISYNFRGFLNGMFENDGIRKNIQKELNQLKGFADTWNKQRDDTIEMLTKKGYPLDMINEKFYRIQEEATIRRDLELRGISINIGSDFIRFPAARMMEYSQFNRVHLTKKKITSNDVVDVQLSAMSPYVDSVVTEKFQANVYKKAKKFIIELKQLEVYTLKDLR